MLLTCVLLALCSGRSEAQMPPAASSKRAIALHPELGKEGSPFNVEFKRRWRIRQAENPAFVKDQDWPLKLAEEVASVIHEYAPEPEIEFKVLLIIKQFSDTWHPLFLPVRAEMTERDIAAARHCFEIQTPDMVHEATKGRVRFAPTVHISSKPLRIFQSGRLDSAEVDHKELIAELAELAKPGDYDSAGCYFLHYDTTSGYRTPRAGYGMGGYYAGVGIGAFAISSAGHMNPRDEIFVHEWMHGLDGFYEKKEGVRLPNGMLHGAGNYDARYSEARAWRPNDTFQGYMEWYADILNGRVPEPGGGFSGLSSVAWKHGPMRDSARKSGARFEKHDGPQGNYPEWVHELMRGDLTRAELSAWELPLPSQKISIEQGSSPWRLESFRKTASTRAGFSPQKEADVMTLECEEGDKAAIVCDAEVAPSANYLFSVEVRATQLEIVQQGGVQAIVIGAAESSLSREVVEKRDWTVMRVPFTAKPGTTTARLRLQMGGDGSLTRGSVQFRHIKLERIGYPATRLIRSAVR